MGSHQIQITCPECSEDADKVEVLVGRKLLERFINCLACGYYLQIEGPYFNSAFRGETDDYKNAPDA